LHFHTEILSPAADFRLRDYTVQLSGYQWLDPYPFNSLVGYATFLAIELNPNNYHSWNGRRHQLSQFNLPLNFLNLAVAILGNATTALFVDRVGRRKFLMVGIIGCILFLVLELAMVAKYVGTSNQAGLSAGGDGYICFKRLV